MAPEQLATPSDWHGALMGHAGQPGAFEAAIGFRTATTAIKAVHVMNDVAQAACGPASIENGDLLASVIRLDKAAEGEPTGDADLRLNAALGAAYSRAFPSGLGLQQIAEIRRAIGLVVNHDGGIYKPGDRMASGLVTHAGLLGADQFHRFGIGGYVRSIIGADALARLQQAYTCADDPLAMLLAPLIGEHGRPEAANQPVPHQLTAFDRALGRGLATLLAQPVAKTARLRMFALGACFGLTLKVMGAGSPDGRPMLFATPSSLPASAKCRRQAAVQSFTRAQQRLVAAVAHHLSGNGEGGRRGPLPAASEEALAAKWGAKPHAEEEALGCTIYWPDDFAVALGRKTGCIQPLRDHGGWGKRVALTADLLEVLVMMQCPHGAAPVTWADHWRRVASELGVFIGANGHADGRELQAAGVVQFSLDDLSKNHQELLSMAVVRGVARLLPDGGAEVGGALE